MPFRGPDQLRLARMALCYALLALLLAPAWLRAANTEPTDHPPTEVVTNLCIPVTILQSPSSFYLASTNKVVLSVDAAGTAPLSFQWYKDGVPIPGANEPSLTISNLHVSDEGFYSVEVSNCGGSVRSRDAAVYLNGIVVGVPEPGTVINFSGSLLPPGLTNIIGISAGAYHALALKQDRTVVAWGNDMADALELTNVPPGLTNVFAVAAGDDYNLALRGDGSLVGWGRGDCAQVPEIHTRILGLAAGPFRASALTEGGTVIQWGVDRTLPPTLQDVVSIAETLAYTAVVKRDGTVEVYGPGPALLFQTTTAISVAADDNIYAIDSAGMVENLTSPAPIFPDEGTAVSAISMRQGRGLILTKKGQLRSCGNLVLPLDAQQASVVAVGGLYCLAITSSLPLPEITIRRALPGQIEIVAPVAVSGWQLAMASGFEEPFQPFDLSLALSRGTELNPALILPAADIPCRFFRLQKAETH